MPKKEPPNPFIISVGKNPDMGCYELMLQLGNLKDKAEADAVAAALRDWLTEGGSGWWKRVNEEVGHG